MLFLLLITTLAIPVKSFHATPVKHHLSNICIWVVLFPSTTDAIRMLFEKQILIVVSTDGSSSNPPFHHRIATVKFLCTFSQVSSSVAIVNCRFVGALIYTSYSLIVPFLLNLLLHVGALLPVYGVVLFPSTTMLVFQCCFQGSSSILLTDFKVTQHLQSTNLSLMGLCSLYEFLCLQLLSSIVLNVERSCSSF